MEGQLFKNNAFFVGLAVLAVLVLMFSLFRKITFEQRRLFETQAMKRGGFVSNRMLLPQLNFRLADISVKVVMTMGGKDKLPHTYVFCEMPEDTEYQFHVFTRKDEDNNFSRDLKEVKVSKGEFDELFTILSNDDKLIREILMDDIMQKLITLKDYEPGFSLSNRKFRFNISKKISNDQELDVIIQTATTIVEKIRSNSVYIAKDRLVK